MGADIKILYETYAPMVYRRCRSILRDEDEALDCMQDVFVKFLVKYPHLEEGGFSSLLYTMATRFSLNALRSRRRGGGRVLALDQVGGEHLAQESHQDAVLTEYLLERILSLTDEKTRHIAWLHYADKLTLEETAAEVGMSVSGIRRRLRMLQKLGREVKER